MEMQTVTQPSRTFQAQGKLHNVTSEAGNFVVAFYKMYPNQYSV